MKEKVISSSFAKYNNDIINDSEIRGMGRGHAQLNSLSFSSWRHQSPLISIVLLWRQVVDLNTLNLTCFTKVWIISDLDGLFEHLKKENSSTDSKEYDYVTCLMIYYVIIIIRIFENKFTSCFYMYLCWYCNVKDHSWTCQTFPS